MLITWNNKIYKIGKVLIRDIQEYFLIYKTIEDMLAKGYVNKKLIKEYCKRLISLYCEPQIKLFYMKDYIKIISKIKHCTQYNDIEKKIDENLKKAEKVKVDLKKTVIDPLYEIFLNYCDWTYKDVEIIPYLEVDDYVRILRQRRLSENLLMLDMLKVGSSQYEIDSYKNLRKQLNREYNELKRSTVDEEKKYALLEKISKRGK